MPTYALYAADLVAIGVLVFGLYLPRHRRSDLIVAFLTANIGVLTVSAALTTSAIGAGLGLGLFGILSIIRLRSEELAQHEIAYYFAALTLGLLGGLDQTPDWVDVALMVGVLAAVGIGDSAWLGRRPRGQQVLLDHAYTDHGALVAHLEALFGGTVVTVKVVRVDIVNDTTLVDVRYLPGVREPAVRR
ncbi:DUF4956 domain-containing protein [Actinokineospora diospyrosa]|uniref:DUF4956 domain-containing protein n=1 Tax=Actinokineospora diospyrosa TaxID=103728 RepID=A0ABT1IBK3_9PSEU|nr:DUF4956 domain-containing protein [Actinokineospora diospyrosa]MCP2269992.1 protein of unknown function (DUF4956) [Actinokineospora diospyrosa]